uniref:ORF20 n=1 Tax=Pacific black duck aviadenovirus TaxID=2798287 RepID=A0A7T4S092_9ADEN|nr:ORF20 [Pacific black duck aviadenovirus]
MFTKAISNIYSIERKSLKPIAENIFTMVMCRCVKIVKRNKNNYRLMNVTIRVASGVKTTFSERHKLLYHLSRRLFYVPSRVYNECFHLISGKYKDFKFYSNGVLISDSISLKVALKSIQFEINCSVVPKSLPFVKYPLYYPKPITNAPIGFLTSLGALKSSILTQPVFLKSMAKSMCPPYIWNIIEGNICYLPGIRHHIEPLNEDFVEHWTLHLHHSADNYHCACTEQCVRECNLLKVHTLQDLCKLEILRQLFNTRRARLMHSTKSRFFYTFRYLHVQE